MEIIRAIHSVSWIYKYIAIVDFAGLDLMVKEEFEAFVSQRDSYAKFLNSAERMKKAKKRAG